MSQFLFQGDFRRRPNQNLGGSSRLPEQRDQVLQKAQEERQKRERERREQAAVLKLQAFCRGIVARKNVYSQWRAEFDCAMRREISQDDLVRRYLLMVDYFFNINRPDDVARLAELSKQILKEQSSVANFMIHSPHGEVTMRRILRKCVRSLDATNVRPAIFIRMIEQFTDVDTFKNDGPDKGVHLLLKIWEYLARIQLGQTQTIFYLYRKFLENRLPKMSDETDGNRFAEKQTHIDYLKIFQNFMNLIELTKDRRESVMSQSQQFIPVPTFGAQLMGQFALAFTQDIIPIPTSPESTGRYVSPNGVTAYYIIPGLANCVPLTAWLLACEEISTTNGNEQDEGEVGKRKRCLLFMSLIFFKRSDLKFTAENIPGIFSVITKFLDGVYFSEQRIPVAWRGMYGRGITLWIAEWKEEEEYNEFEMTIYGKQDDPPFASDRIVLHETKMVYQLLVQVFNKPEVATYMQAFDVVNWKLLAKFIAHVMRMEPKLSNVDLRIIASLSFDKSFMQSLSSETITILRYRINDREEIPDEDILSFCWFFYSLLNTLHDNEFFAILPLGKENLGKLMILLGELYYDDVRRSPNTVSTLTKAMSSLLMKLHDRNCRMEVFMEDIFISQSMSNISPVETHSLRFQNFLDGIDPEPSTGNNNLEEVMLTVLKDFPFLLSFHDRVKVWNRLINKDRLANDPYPMTHRSDIQVRRNFIYEDAYEKLSPENVPDMRRSIRVSLVNVVGVMEAGIDGGGLLREFLTEATKAAVDPNRGLFRTDSQNRIYPNPVAKKLMSDFRKHFFVVGRLVGKALYEQTLLELPMAAFFIQYCIEGKVSSAVDFLATLDPPLHKNLLALKTYPGDLTTLGLDFTIVVDELGQTTCIDLKPNGAEIAVDESNIIEYIHLVADYKINKEMEEECKSFRAGMMDVIPYLRMFSWKELQSLISGCDKPINVSDWRAHTNYGPGYSDNHPTIQMYWKVVKNFDETSLRMLLKFVTSCSRPPLLGFKDLVPKFGITNAGRSDRLPTAATCMNLLKLPEFDDPKTLKTKLIYAINAQAGFELS